MPPLLPQLDGVSHRTLVVRGLRLHVAEAGAGDPLLLQHGWPQHWWMWRELIQPLAARYRVICPDLRGHGWSGAPPDGDYLKETLVDDLLALLDELGLERVRYAGHDWGGWAGFLLALRAPERLERLAALSIPPPWRPPGRPDPRALLRIWYQVPLASPLPAAIKLRMVDTVLARARRRGSYTAAELETYLAPLREPDGLEATTGMYRSFLRRELPALARGEHDGKRLTVPTLLLIGDRDPVRQENTRELLEANADDARCEVVPGAGHFLPEERPEVVSERLLEFFSQPVSPG